MELIGKKYQQSSVVFITGREAVIRVFIIDWFSYNYKAEQNRTE